MITTDNTIFTNRCGSLAQTREEVSENSKSDHKEEEAEHNFQLCEGGIVGGPCKGDVLDTV